MKKFRWYLLGVLEVIIMLVFGIVLYFLLTEKTISNSTAIWYAGSFMIFFVLLENLCSCVIRTIPKNYDSENFSLRVYRTKGFLNMTYLLTIKSKKHDINKYKIAFENVKVVSSCYHEKENSIIYRITLPAIWSKSKINIKNVSDEVVCEYHF